MAHDAHLSDDRLVLFQAHEQIGTSNQYQQHQHREPEIRAPLRPLERIVLHVLWREELVGVQRVHVYRYDLQRRRAALVGLAVHFHRQGRYGIEALSKRGDDVGFLNLHLAA